MTLDFFVEKILKELFAVDPESVFCLQDVPSRGLFDLTFISEMDCLNFYDHFKDVKSHDLLRGVTIWLLYSRPLRPLVIHLYNPFVLETDILCFLHRYCSEVKEGTKVRNKYGFWTGKRRFMVKFKTDPLSAGGYQHPPGIFAIGPDRGYLYYPGMPVYCRRCGLYGHLKDDCKNEKCRNCGAEHKTNECAAPKRCSLCSSPQHLFRACPERRKTYAEMIGGAAAPPGGREVDSSKVTDPGPVAGSDSTAVRAAGGRAKPKPNPGSDFKKGFPEDEVPGPSNVPVYTRAAAGPVPGARLPSTDFAPAQVVSVSGRVKEGRRVDPAQAKGPESRAETVPASGSGPAPDPDRSNISPESPDSAPDSSPVHSGFVQRFRRAAAAAFRSKQAGGEEIPAPFPDPAPIPKPTQDSVFTKSRAPASEAASSTEGSSGLPPSAVAAEVAGLASVDLETPPSWGDIADAEETMKWAKVAGRKRASAENADPSKIHKSGSEVMLSNRYDALTFINEASLDSDENSGQGERHSPGPALEWDMGGFMMEGREGRE